MEGKPPRVNEQSASEGLFSRHGETAWSISGQHIGRTDIPLTERCKHAAQELSARLKGLRFCQSIHQPLQQAPRNGGLAGFGESTPADPDLMAWDYGTYENLMPASTALPTG